MYSYLCTREIRNDMENLLVELCEEQVYTYIRPTDVKLQKKQRKVESEVSDLRTKLSSATLSKNIVLSNREIRLLRFLFIFFLTRELLFCIFISYQLVVVHYFDIKYKIA